jgi:hypothetical protein
MRSKRGFARKILGDLEKHRFAGFLAVRGPLISGLLLRKAYLSDRLALSTGLTADAQALVDGGTEKLGRTSMSVNFPR